MMVRLVTITMLAALLQGAASSPAAAGAFNGHPADAFVVCNPRRCCCWLEPGTHYRFNRLFTSPRVLTEPGALGTWQRVRVRERWR
jgi:hypothetical protein